MVQAFGGGVAPDVFGEFGNTEAVACLGAGVAANRVMTGTRWKLAGRAAISPSRNVVPSLSLFIHPVQTYLEYQVQQDRRQWRQLRAGEAKCFVN